MGSITEFLRQIVGVRGAKKLDGLIVLLLVKSIICSSQIRGFGRLKLFEVSFFKLAELDDEVAGPKELLALVEVEGVWLS